jgi:hypothetical protein
MSVLDKVLALRPANVATRLGAGSRVPFLNPRDLVRALGELSGALLTVPVGATFALPGLLRAARDADAPLGFRCPYQPDARGAGAAFFEAVRAAAEELHHQRPLFLEAGPVPIPTADDAALARVAAEVFAFVDAGYGLVSLDASGLEAEAAAEAYRQAAQAATERELSLEVAAPLVEGRASPRALEELLDALRAMGVAPRFVRVASSALAFGGALDAPLLDEWRQVAADRDTDVCMEEHSELPVKGAEGWVAAGVRRVVAAETFERVLIHVSGNGNATAAPDIRARERIEALWYGEAVDLFPALGSGGAGSRAMTFLAENAGY